MSDTETPTEDAVLDVAPAAPTFQSTAAMPFAMSTGMRVRADLYDEDYTSDEYEAMLTMYNGTMASIEEGEIVKSQVLEIRDNLVVLDIGFKSEGTIPLEEFKDMPDLKAGDEVEVLLEHLEDQEGSVVLSKKKADFMRVWETHPRRLRERPAGRRHARQEDQGWRGRRPHGRRRVPPGLADRAASRAEHRRAARPEVRVQDHQAQQAPPQHRRVAPRDPRDRARRQAREADEGARRRTRCGRASSRTSPTSARSSTSAASTACCTSPTCRGAASRIRARWSRSARSSRSRSSTSIGSASASRSASSSSRAIRGRTSPTSTRSARACRARSSRSPTTARSSSSSRASKASCTSPR